MKYLSGLDKDKLTLSALSSTNMTLFLYGKEILHSFAIIGGVCPSSSQERGGGYTIMVEEPSTP